MFTLTSRVFIVNRCVFDKASMDSHRRKAMRYLSVPEQYRRPGGHQSRSHHSHHGAHQNQHYSPSSRHHSPSSRHHSPSSRHHSPSLRPPQDFRGSRRVNY
ncbi:unnamed protein product, partial [Nesidiocoris tenuis]